MKILAVMVRYQTLIEESQAAQGFCAAFQAEPSLAQSYELIIWDNSPDPIQDRTLPIPFHYQHSQANVGIAGAANAAAEFAIEQGFPWMLLVDQDTRVTSQFLRLMLQHSRALLAREEIAAIVPTVRVGTEMISPKQQLMARSRSYPQGECGIAPDQATAINSGSMLRVTALRAIGGYSSDFWLDYSDVYIYRQFFLHGFKVWRAADAILDHDLSLLDYDRLMSPWRAANFSQAEAAFNDLYNSGIENAILTLRLFLRAIKHRMKYANPEFAHIAWKQLIYRMRFSRTERIVRLKGQMSPTAPQVRMEIASHED